jgi:hypothetical protein
MSLLALIPLIGDIPDKALPDAGAAATAKLEVMRLAQSGELAQMNAETSLALGQIEVNKIEAASSSTFVSGWRPGAGWVCVAGLAYSVLAQPMLAWLSAVQGWPVPPVVGTEVLMGLLTGLLGLGGYRTAEKIKGLKISSAR